MAHSERFADDIDPDEESDDYENGATFGRQYQI